MREVPGQRVPVNGRAVYVEESGQGPDWVVFEAGQGCGRTPQLPTCPTIVLSATRAAKGGEGQNAAIREHQRRYADGLADGRYDGVDSAHFIQAEQPQLVVAHIQQLLQATA